MRSIRSPLDGLLSPFGARLGGSTGPTSLKQRDGAPILDRFGAEIFTGPQGAIPATAIRQRDDEVIYNRAGTFLEIR